MALELYHSHISTCSQKVRIALAEKGIDWVSRPVDLSKHENLTPEFLAINPNGVVPAFVHDGRPIYESTVMCEYLDERWPDAPRLSPDDLVDRALMRAWLRWIDEVPSMAIRVPSFRNVFLSHFQKKSPEEFDAFVEANPLRKHFFKRMGQKGFSDEEYEAAIEQLDRSLARMDAALDGHDWLVADRFSIADICITPVIVRMEDIDMAGMWDGKFPRVAAWYARVQARPSFKAAYYPGTRISWRRPSYAAKAM